MAADNDQLPSEPLNRKRSLDDVAYVEQAGEETANDDGKKTQFYLSSSPLFLSSDDDVGPMPILPPSSDSETARKKKRGKCIGKDKGWNTHKIISSPTSRKTVLGSTPFSRHV